MCPLEVSISENFNELYMQLCSDKTEGARFCSLIRKLAVGNLVVLYNQNSKLIFTLVEITSYCGRLDVTYVNTKEISSRLDAKRFCSNNLNTFVLNVTSLDFITEVIPTIYTYTIYTY